MGIAENLHDLRERIARACESVSRDPATVTLVAVTKTFPTEAIREAYDLGHRDFGESRLQEALPKIAALPGDVRWHFVGKLQSNKAKRAAAQFHTIHTLESPSQLDEIAKAGRQVEGFIEVNVSGETQKSGISPKSLDDFVKTVLYCPQVCLRGLMAIGPLAADVEQVRKAFRLLRELRERIPGTDALSMGMSADLEVAIQEGSTHVRVGTAIFGKR